MKRFAAALLTVCILLSASAAFAAKNSKKGTSVTKIIPDHTRLVMAPNTVWTLFCTVEPADAGNKDLAWSSSNEQIATVNAYGAVRARKTGTCRITCKAKDGSGITAAVSIQVKDHDIVIRNPGDLKVNFETAPAMVNITVRNKGVVSKKTCERQFHTENECVSSPTDKVLRPLKAGTDTISLVYIEGKTTVKTERRTVFVAPSAVGETMRLLKNGKPAPVTFLGIPWGSAWPTVRETLEKQGRGLKALSQRNDYLRSMLDGGDILFGNIPAYAAAANFTYTADDRMWEVRNALFRGDLYFDPEIPFETVMQAARSVYALNKGKKTGNKAYAWQRGHVSVTLTWTKRYTVLELLWDGTEE